MGMAARRLVIPLSTRMEPGSWHVNRRGLVTVVCPVCYEPFALRSYDINNGGTVEPRVRCGSMNCPWRSRLALGSWNRTKTRTTRKRRRQSSNAGERRQNTLQQEL